MKKKELQVIPPSLLLSPSPRVGPEGVRLEKVQRGPQGQTTEDQPEVALRGRLRGGGMGMGRDW
jgi:hypothetical protein